MEYLYAIVRPFICAKNLNNLQSLINHPRFMSEPSYDILPKRGRPLSYGTEKYKDKDKDKDEKPFLNTSLGSLQ